MTKYIVDSNYRYGKTSNNWQSVLKWDVSKIYPEKRIFIVENTHPQNGFLLKYKVRFASIVYETNELEIAPMSLKVFDKEMYKLVSSIEIFMKNSVTDKNSNYKIDYMDVK